MKATRYIPTLTSINLGEAIDQIDQERDEARALHQGYDVWTWHYAPYVVIIRALGGTTIAFGYENPHRAFAHFDQIEVNQVWVRSNPDWELLASKT